MASTVGVNVRKWKIDVKQDTMGTCNHYTKARKTQEIRYIRKETCNFSRYDSLSVTSNTSACSANLQNERERAGH